MKKLFSFFGCLLLFSNAVEAQTMPPGYVNQNGLVGWWPFSGSAADQSNWNNHGVVNGAVLTTDRAGNAGSAYMFDGSSSYIEVTDAASLRVRNLTMAAWVYSTNPNPDVRNMRDEIIYKARKSDAYGEAYSLQMGMSSAVKIGSNCQAGVSWRVGGFNNQVAPVGVWTHLCTTFDGSYMRNYINGVEVEVTAISGLIDSCIGSNLRFGYAHDKYGKAWSGPFLGKIDDIGIWNRALYPGEITELYKGTPIAASAGDTIVRHPNGITPATASQIKLAPNPARNAFTISSAAAGEQLKVAVTDLAGRIVLQEIFMGSEKTISLNGIAGGLYLVTIANLQGTPIFREKIVVD